MNTVSAQNPHQVPTSQPCSFGSQVPENRRLLRPLHVPPHSSAGICPQQASVFPPSGQKPISLERLSRPHNPAKFPGFCSYTLCTNLSGNVGFSEQSCVCFVHCGTSQGPQYNFCINWISTHRRMKLDLYLLLCTK